MIDVDASRGTRTHFGFALAIITQIIMIAGATAPSPFYPALADTIGFDAATITIVFAVYAVALLITLLTLGSLSDFIGRKPIAVTGLVLLTISMLIFWNAQNVAMLVGARVLQGVASGMLTPTLSAVVLDCAPTGRQQVAALWNALSAGIGMTVGSLIAGISLDLLSEPMLAVFGSFAATYVVLAALFLAAPETAPRRRGVWASLSFRLKIPPSIRASFWRALPAVAASWATCGLFLSLSANIVRDELGAGAHVLQSLPVAFLTGTGALAALVLRGRRPRTLVSVGTAATAIGILMSLIALRMSSLAWYLSAAAVTGIGFGTIFSGVIASLIPRIPTRERADTFSVLYLVAYLSFSAPTLIAGASVRFSGLGAAYDRYGVVVVALAVTALALQARRAK